MSPSSTLKLPATATDQTKVLLLGVVGDHSTYGKGLDTILSDGTMPANSLDHSYFLPDPTTQASYLLANSYFSQTFINATGTSDYRNFPTKIQGTPDTSFVKAVLAQTLDPGKRASRLVVPQLNDNLTDIQIYNVYVTASPQGVQYVLPGGKSNPPRMLPLSDTLRTQGLTYQLPWKPLLCRFGFRAIGACLQDAGILEGGVASLMAQTGFVRGL